MNSVRLVYLRDSNKVPVGCVAYRDLEPNVFAYGVSFRNSEADLAWKEGARHVACGRLRLAEILAERKNCQGRFGTIEVRGNSLNEKVADLLQKIATKTLHGKSEVRERMVVDLLVTAHNLLKQKTVAA
jgi:hypothetical protein